MVSSKSRETELPRSTEAEQCHFVDPDGSARERPGLALHVLFGAFRRRKGMGCGVPEHRNSADCRIGGGRAINDCRSASEGKAEREFRVYGGRNPLVRLFDVDEQRLFIPGGSQLGT